MRYLYGDSTESDVDFHYLTFLRQAIDCAVLLVKHRVARVTATERRNAKDIETAAAVKALEDFGVQVTENYAPIAKDDTPLGRVMKAMSDAAADAIEQESSRLRTALRGEIDREVQDDRGDRMRCVAALEQLLCAHDLPGAETTREVIWKEGVAKAQLAARAPYATAVLTLDVPGSSLLAGEQRVERLVDGLEIMAIEESGWLKKSPKPLPHKLGRFVITRVGVGTTATTIRMRAETGGGLDVIVPKDGEIRIERVGENALREPSVDGKQVATMRALADKLETAIRALDKRTQLVTLDLEGSSFLDHPTPHVLAEKLVEVIAPVMQTIAKHSRNPEELVLRRQLSDDRREEVFVRISDLASKLDVLPPEARQVFAPLGLAAKLTTPVAATTPLPDPAPAVAAPSLPALSGPLPLPAIAMPGSFIPPRRPPVPPPPMPPRTRVHAATLELDTATDIIEDEPPAPAPLASSNADVASAVEKALDAISGGPEEEAPRLPSVISELAAAAERKPLPRALIIETGEYQPLTRPDAPEPKEV